MKRDNGEGDMGQAIQQKQACSRGKRGHCYVRADAVQHVVWHCFQLLQWVSFLATSMNWPSGQEGSTLTAMSMHEINVCRKERRERETERRE